MSWPNPADARALRKRFRGNDRYLGHAWHRGHLVYRLWLRDDLDPDDVDSAELYAGSAQSYADDDSPIDPPRPCKRCDAQWPEGEPDPCLGRLPGVKAACCGHGSPIDGYALFRNGVLVRGINCVSRHRP